jgi:hypothetical protein
MKRFIAPIDPNDPEPTEYRVIDKAYIDGYPFGERILDGVIFEITIENDAFKAKITPKCADYFAKLNEKRWLAEAEEYAARNDVFGVDPDMREQNEAVCWDDALPNDEQTFNCEETPIIVP